MLQMHFGCAKMLCFLLCKKQRCVHFVTQNVTNAFLQRITFSFGKCSAVQKCIWCVAKMHFCIKCIWCCAKMHFCTASNAFLQRNAYIFLWKMFSCAKMHLMLCKNKFLHHILLVRCQNAFVTFCVTKCYKCILAYIFLWKMFSVHFPKENVQQNKMLQMHLMLCKNAFLHHILFCKNAFLHQQNVTNAFWHQMQRSHRKKIKIILKKLYWYESEES